MVGIYNVYKPKDWTSFDVVNKLKHILKIKHIGHLGTLDPMAEGVLPIAIGKATKLFDYFLNKEKEYIATFKVGIETDTLDITGKIIQQSSKRISKKDVLEMLPKFLGTQKQTPPKYSAVKINGKRAYSLARDGKEFEIKSKSIEIKKFELVNYSKDEMTFDIVCSAGTYIRVLGNDLFKALGCCASMSCLKRVRAGLFEIKDTKTIEQIEKNITETITKIEDVFNSLPRVILSDENIIIKAKNGVKINTGSGISGEALIFTNNELLGFSVLNNGVIKDMIFLNEGEN